MVDGVNVCEVLTAVGRFKEVKRTTGISTTDLTGRLLSLIEQSPECEEENVQSVKRFEDPPKQTFL